MIPGTTITVTTHAVEEATKKLGIPAENARKWVQETASKAQFIAYTTGSDGKQSRLFAYQRVAYVFDVEDSEVITVYPQHKSSEDVRTQVDRLVKRLMRQADKKEAETIKRIERRKAELMVEAAQLNLKRIDTRSKAAVNACNARINAINEEIEALNVEVAEARDEKRRIAKSMVMYVS